MNPWTYRALALITLLFVYGAGLSGGQQQCKPRPASPAFLRSTDA